MEDLFRCVYTIMYTNIFYIMKFRSFSWSEKPRMWSHLIVFFYLTLNILIQKNTPSEKMINLLSSQYIFQVKIVIKRLFKKASVSLNLSNTSTKFVYQVQSVFMFDIVVAQGTFSVSRSFPDKIRRCICSETSFSSWILILILSMVPLGSTSKVMIFPVKSFTYYFM